MYLILFHYITVTSLFEKLFENKVVSPYITLNYGCFVVESDPVFQGRTIF